MSEKQPSMSSNEEIEFTVDTRLDKELNKKEKTLTEDEEKERKAIEYFENVVKDTESMLKNDEKAEKKDKKAGCQGCTGYRGFKSKLIPSIEDIPEKEINEAVDKVSQLIRKYENIKYKQNDFQEGSPAIVNTIFVKTLLNKTVDVKDKKIAKNFVEKILSYDIKGLLESAENELIKYESSDRYPFRRGPHDGNSSKVAIDHEDLEEFFKGVMKSDLPKKEKDTYLEKFSNWAPLSEVAEMDFKLQKEILLLKKPEERADYWSLLYGQDKEYYFYHNLQLIKLAAESGLSIDYKKYLNELREKSKDYKDSLVQIDSLEEKINKLKGEKREDLGPGLKMEKSNQSGGVKVYLDGEFIDTVTDGEFSDKPTNGEVVAWVTRKIIDRDEILMGTQYRDAIYAWKKGMDRPEEVFEDHAWTKEREFSVSTPKVQPDGTIVVEVQKDVNVGNTKKIEFKI
jgi:hypothetical protein